MYKVLIVDDELSIRRGIANSIPWENLGFTVSGQASDGLEAIRKIKQDKPQLVISDIRMPKMDGVELMQYLNEHYPEIKIVILSGYSDFEYLNMSIKNNVTEYLLKPTDLDEFEDLLRRMKKKLDEEAQKAQKDEMNSIYRKNHIMEMLLKGYTDKGELPGEQEILRELNIYEQNCAAVLLYFDDDMPGDKAVGYDMKIRAIEHCGKYQNEHGLNTVFYLNNQENMIFIVSKEQELQREEIIECVKEIQASIYKRLQKTVSAGIGQICNDSRLLPQSYEQAVCAAHQQYFNEKEKIIFYTTIKDEESYYSIEFNYEEITKNIVKGNEIKIAAEIDRVFDEFEQKAIKEYQYIEQTCLELLFYLSRWALNYNIRLEQLMQEKGLSYTDLRKLVGMEHRKRMILNVLYTLSESVNEELETRKNSSLAQVLRDFVDKEYMSNSMSLEYVASRVRKSGAYVSKVFKEEIGCNFSDYVQNKRLEKSRELLADPRLKIYEVAKMTGYADVSNFIKVFKKKYGVSPGDYRSITERNPI